MAWRETSRDIFSLDLAAGIRLAVFRPTYEGERWHYSMNGKDSVDGFSSLQAAQTAALMFAIAQTELSFSDILPALIFQVERGLLSTRKSRSRAVLSEVEAAPTIEQISPIFLTSLPEFSSR